MDLLSAQRVLYTVSLPHLRFMKGDILVCQEQLIV